MADGALSWLALVAGRYLADGEVPRRGELELAGGLVCYRPYACKDGWVTLGALEPKFWQEWCRGVGREDLIEKQFETPGSEAHAEVERVFLERTRDEWQRFASEHDCCLEPVLDLDEALDSELVRAREMVVELEQPGAERPVRQLGVPVKLSRTPGQPQGPGPGARRAHPRGAGVAGLRGRGDRRARAVRRGGRAGERRPGLVHVVNENGLLKMKELAEASGVSAGTIKHYLREGLLPEPVRTSRNMAYYPPEFVERIRLIKQLQEERFMPLKLIRSLLERDTGRAMVSAAELKRRYDVPQEVLDRLAELEVLSPKGRGYAPRDVEIVAAISRFRAGGYDERIGFTVYDTLRYKSALEALVKEEVEVLLQRVAGRAGRRPRDRADRGRGRAAERPDRGAAPEAVAGGAHQSASCHSMTP